MRGGRKGGKKMYMGGGGESIKRGNRPREKRHRRLRIITKEEKNKKGVRGI